MPVLLVEWNSFSIRKQFIYWQFKKHFFQDVEAKYSKVVDKSEKVIFLCNNIDPYVCKKIVIYVYEAF